MRLYAFASLLIASIAVADGEPPLVRKVLSSSPKPVAVATSPGKATGKVVALPATSLPPGAIIPLGKTLAPQKQASYAGSASPHNDIDKQAPAATAIFVLTDHNLRWQLYSYP